MGNGSFLCFFSILCYINIGFFLFYKSVSDIFVIIVVLSGDFIFMYLVIVELLFY